MALPLTVVGAFPNSDLHPLVKSLCYFALTWHTGSVLADTKPSSTGRWSRRSAPEQGVPWPCTVAIHQWGWTQICRDRQWGLRSIKGIQEKFTGSFTNKWPFCFSRWVATKYCHIVTISRWRKTCAALVLFNTVLSSCCMPIHIKYLHIEFYVTAHPHAQRSHHKVFYCAPQQLRSIKPVTDSGDSPKHQTSLCSNEITSFPPCPHF